MFVGKAGTYPSEASFRCPTIVPINNRVLEWLAKKKHSSLLLKFVNYGRKSFIGLAPVFYYSATRSQPIGEIFYTCRISTTNISVQKILEVVISTNKYTISN